MLNEAMQGKFTHLDSAGNASMVDVASKTATSRSATAEGFVYMNPNVLSEIEKGLVKKGNVLSVAQLAGIMGGKKTAELIPLCHPLGLDSLQVELSLQEDAVRIVATASIAGKTGVEMEALTAVSVSALTVYDMCKSYDKSMRIGGIRLLAKSGGKSGDYRAE